MAPFDATGRTLALVSSNDEATVAATHRAMNAIERAVVAHEQLQVDSSRSTSQPPAVGSLERDRRTGRQHTKDRHLRRDDPIQRNDRLFPLRRQRCQKCLLTCGNGARGRIRTDDLPITRRMLGVGLDGSRRI